MKAIFTKYLGPTNSRGSRVKAYDGDGNQVTLDWESSLDSDQNHKRAAYHLCMKMQWKGNLVMGSHKDVNVHVFTERDFRKEAGKALIFGYSFSEVRE